MKKHINDQVLTTKLCFCSGGVSDSQNQWVKEVLKMAHFETYPGGPGVGQGKKHPLTCHNAKFQPLSTQTPKSSVSFTSKAPVLP